jgi:uroporphyrinogen decarboxylase
MTPRSKTLLRALGGEAVWPPPIWLMRQAGRYLPEYRALRAETADFVSFCLDTKRATEATLQPIRRFGMDGAILFSDILILPWALGRDLSFAEGHGPVLEPLRLAHEVSALDEHGFLRRVEPVLETIGRLREKLAEESPGTALIGFVGAPFTVACYMIEGGGSKDFATARGLAAREPAMFGRLIERLTETSSTYLLAQIKAGAEAVMIFDSWSGLLPPDLFRRYVVEPTAQIAAIIKARHPQVPVIGFPRLAGTMIAAYGAGAGVDTMGMDTASDPGVAARLVPPGLGLQGNLDPFALLAGGDALAEAAYRILGAMRGRPFVFNLGHGVMPPTPPEHVAALVDLVRGV